MPATSGKCGIVTGAARGLGAACARQLIEAGHQVILADMLEPELLETTRGLGSAAQAAVVDLRIEDEVSGLVGSAVAKFGRLDFVVQNAAVQVEKPLHLTTTEEWDRLHEVNLRAVFWGAKYALTEMLKGGGGSIVNIGSVMSLKSDPILAAYSTMKHGVLGLTRSIAVNSDYATAGIRANCVCPGDILTDMQQAYWSALPNPELGRKTVEAHYPSKRIGLPDEVAKIVAFLVSDDSSLINGAEIVADTGRLPLYY